MIPPQKSAGSGQRPNEVPENKTSPYQIKQKYTCKSEFYKIFKHLMELEEAEEVKPFYENEKGLYFLNQLEYTNLKDYLSLFEDFTCVKKLKILEDKIEISDNQRRLALFSDYKFKMNTKELGKIVIENTKGDKLEAEIRTTLDFYLFIFDNDVPLDITSFNISYQIQSFQRIKEGMKLYLDYEVDPVINSIFLGHRTKKKLDFKVEIKDYTAFDLFALNNSQIEAVKKALKYRVSIIQGPPGTGKTQTISSIVYHINNLCRPKIEKDSESCDDYDGDDPNYQIHRLYNYNSPYIAKYFTKTSKILICAASNSPVFDIRRKLIDKGINALQILARSKENEYQNDLGTLKAQYNIKMIEDIKLNELREKLRYLNSSNSKSKEFTNLKKKIDGLERNIELSIVKNSDIICCTTRVLQNNIFNLTSFDFAIVDEATQCIEPDIVLCLLKDVKHLILVGDIHQLGPVIKSKTAKHLGFDMTTIERLQDLGVPFTLLDTQYRMQPFLSKFSNVNFYGGKLNDGILETCPLNFPKIVKSHGFFYHIKSKEEKKSKGSSFFNSIEAEAVINIVRYLRSRNIKNKNIGIITFYGGQREYLRGLIKKNRFEHLEIMSVDESQGREKEYIILSCVRSNDYKNVGFLDEYRRLNVAMTRVKYGLVVCGNANTFVKSELWCRLVSYFQVNNAIFSGDVFNLRPYRVRLKDYEPFSVKRTPIYLK